MIFNLVIAIPSTTSMTWNAVVLLVVSPIVNFSMKSSALVMHVIPMDHATIWTTVATHVSVHLLATARNSAATLVIPSHTASTFMRTAMFITQPILPLLQVLL